MDRCYFFIHFGYIPFSLGWQSINKVFFESSENNYPATRFICYDTIDSTESDTKSWTHTPLSVNG